MKKNNLKYGIIGTGRMAQARAKALNILNCKIEWVCSRTEEKGRKFAQKYNIKKVITDWEQGCQDPEVTSIIITSPNNLHYKMAVKALKNDKDVLVEYPLAIKQSDAQKIYKNAEKSSGKLHVGLTYRVSALHTAIKKNLQKLGKIGTCLTLQCSGNKISRWFDNKEKVGNVIIGSNFHFVDALIDWFGKVEWVDADIYEETKKDDENQIIRDIGSIMLKFKNGISGYVSYARGYEQPGIGFDRKIIGEKGYIVEVDGQAEFWSPEGKTEIKVENTKDSIVEDTRMFVDLIINDNQPLYTPEDGVYGLEVVEAAFKSVSKGKRIYL